MQKKVNTDLQLQVDELNGKLGTSIRIKGEYEELIAGLFEDKDTHRKINTALKELDRSRRPTRIVMNQDKVTDKAGPKEAKASKSSNSLLLPQRKKTKKKLKSAKS